MKKSFIISLFLIGVFFLQIPAASAWNWNTHQEIVESNYNTLPSDMKQNLDLNAMKDGSDDPDFKFFDFQYHRYPDSRIKMDEWLNKGQEHYKNGDYYSASYCFGVASHYITDSFAAPHCAGFKGPDHTLYETKASLIKPELKRTDGNLNSLLIDGQSTGKSDWNNWINIKNDSYIQNDLNKATDASYSTIYNSISNSHPVEGNKSNNNFLMSIISLI